MIIELIFLFAFGAIAGSFLNVVILRYLQDTPIHGRSLCPNCAQQLRWWELIPIASFFMLGARCSHCGRAISWQYPIIEGIAGLSALAVFTPAPTSAIHLLDTILVFIVVCLLIILAGIDWHSYILPDTYVLSVSGIVMLLLLLRNQLFDLSWISGATLGASFLGMLWLMTRGHGIGLGDVKLLIPLGALFGGRGVAALLWLSFMIGGIVAIYLVLMRRTKLKAAVPFGPLLVAVALLLVAAPQTVDYLFSFLGW
jgi:prepilin signal peptidase PulO-like enzyme (type II secretory pathway)